MADKTAKPRAKVVVVQEYCTHAAGSDCLRCTHICPHDAIDLPKLPGVPHVDIDRCNGCGVCFGICDTFASTHLTMADLHARIRRIATSGRRAYLTCRENIFPELNIDTNVVVLPCLSMVPPELWTLLLAENIRVSVACDLKYCEDCQRAGDIGGTLFPRAIEMAEERTGGSVKFSYRIPEKQKLIDKYAKSTQATDRRGAFTDLAADFGEIASGKRRLRNSQVLADYYAKKERQRAIARLNLVDEEAFPTLTPEGFIRHLMMPRRKMLLEAISRQEDIADNIEIALSVTDTTLCRGSGECVRLCPTGARRFAQDDSDSSSDGTGNADGDGTPVVDATLCIGCGICVDSCPEAAVSLVPVTGRVWLEGIEQSD